MVIAHTKKQLVDALSAALDFGSGAIIEEYVAGREFSVGVLEGKALEPIEIVPHEGFYDFKNKYQAGLTDEICPANLTDGEKDEIRSLALTAHRALRLGSYSRIDFIYDGSRFVCLEANTLPGMTPTSLLPKEAAAQGISYGELCEKIVMAE